jgi:hypothetical protein
MSAIRENRLFLGNPGAGKSALINCLLGGNHMQSGISWGGGLTKDYQRFVKDGIAYFDTPGLADETIQREAADAITKALKQSGTYKLFFLVRLQNGRVVSDDLVTLERVLDSIDAGDLNYKFTIVMNCVGQRQYESLMKRGDEFKTIKTLINRRYLTESFCFIPCIKALEERSDTVVELPHEIRAFIEVEAPVIRVEEVQVKPIAVVGFAQQSQAIKMEIEKLRNDHAALLRVMQEQERRHAETMQRVRASHAIEIDRVGRGPTVATAVISPRHTDYSHIPSTPTTTGFLSRFSRRTRFVALVVSLVVVIGVVVGVLVGTKNSSTSPPPPPATKAPTSGPPIIIDPTGESSPAPAPPPSKTPTPTPSKTPAPTASKTPTPTPTPSKAPTSTFVGCHRLGTDLTALKPVSQPGSTEKDGMNLAVLNRRNYFVIMTSGTVTAFDTNLSIGTKSNPPTCKDQNRTLKDGYWNVFKVTYG